MVHLPVVTQGGASLIAIGTDELKITQAHSGSSLRTMVRLVEPQLRPACG